MPKFPSDMVLIQIRVPKPLLDRLDQYCKTEGRSRSETIRNAIDHFLRHPHEAEVAAYGPIQEASD